MAHIDLPYGRATLPLELPEERITAVLRSRADEYTPDASEEALVINALQNPIGSPTLSQLSKSARHVVIITSDHTRPVPSHITMPLLLEAVRKGSEETQITILIATGLHRETTRDELRDRFGDDIVSNEHIVVHNAKDDSSLVLKGILPSGGELWLNRLVDEADLLIAEGFIEPHFFAGFSGGRKAVLPGIAGAATVLWNHNAGFIGDPNSRAGILESNIINRDMLFASRKVNLRFVLNVAIGPDKKIIGAFSGDPEKAHSSGCEFVKTLAKVPAARSDVVITTNGGYPLDQNIYQAVKSMSAAEPCLNDGGVVIACSRCEDGHGGETFYRDFSGAKDIESLWERISNTPSEETKPDQWQSQVLARIMRRFKIIMVTDPSVAQLVSDMKMHYAKDLHDALQLAEKLQGRKGSVTIIPDGVSVIVG